MAQEEFVEGWTERVEQQLMNNGVPVPMAGFSDGQIQLELYSRSGVLIPIVGATGFTDNTVGKVHYDPAPGDLLAKDSPIGARWKVTDDTGRVSDFPRGAIDAWIVRKP